MQKPGNHVQYAPQCPDCPEALGARISFKAGTKHLNLLPPLEVVRCAHCGLLFMDPRPTESDMDALYAGNVPESLKAYSSKTANYVGVTNERLHLFRERVSTLLKKGWTKAGCCVLDIGCSSGTFLEAAQEAGLYATGLEPSLTGVEACQSKGLEVTRGSAEHLPFDSETFDFVHSHHVFEHLRNPFLAASEVFRVLKPGGRIFIEVPNQFDNIHFFRDRLFGRIPVRQRNIRSIHHLYFFSVRNLKKLFMDAGFEQVVVTSYYLKPRGGLGFLGSMLMKCLGALHLGGPFVQVSAIKPE